MEDRPAYRYTTEVSLLYVPAHDTPHQSIAVVETFQRDQFSRKHLLITASSTDVPSIDHLHGAV